MNPTRWTAIGLLALAAGVAWAQPAAPATPGADLVARAREWLAATYQVAPAAIGVQALDARVQSRGCAGGWQFDLPFPGNDGMLRARCAEPAWQVFVKVTLPPQATAQAPATPARPALAQAPQPVPPSPVAYTAPAPAPFAPAAPAPVLVKRGQVVLTTWAPVPGLMVSARLEAMDDGRLGETVRLKNRDTGRIVTAVVSGQNAAQGL